VTDRSLLSPKWIISHVLVAVALVVMILLGFWQLDRLGQRRDRNAEIASRVAEPVTPIDELVSIEDPYAVGESLRYRVASASGVYLPDEEVLVRNRSLGGSAGFWVITPLRLADGSAVVVNRGWVPFSMGPGASRAGTEPPQGQVTVTGLVQQSATAGLLQSDDAPDGVLESLARIDLARYGAQLDEPVLPVFIQLESQAPAQSSTLPVMLARPELGEGPHLSYAVQWFVFATIAALGYPLVLRRVGGGGNRKKRPSPVPVDYL
jgi:surfeit locus 1 family protein